ncbi:uncharacterized protein LOC109836652 [Asparagus officinalis]|uniref:uncharacterized protein LOC109836652 n=1 Tax=Asparagus officinalis TaxID=4686 RepID=UPI00098DFBEC|nr:uncharacterized protein LOC109836652 [Asparagus officinalis]
MVGTCGYSNLSGNSAPPLEVDPNQLLAMIQGLVTNQQHLAGQLHREPQHQPLPRAESGVREFWFVELKQGGRSFDEYEAEFSSLSQYTPHLATDPTIRRHQFQKGLDKYIRFALAGRALAMHDAVLDATREIESMQKELKDPHVIQSRAPVVPARIVERPSPRQLQQEPQRQQHSQRQPPSQVHPYQCPGVQSHGQSSVKCTHYGYIGQGSCFFCPALSLYDSGASHCFLSRRFVSAYSLPITPLTTGWNINTGSGVLVASSGYEACPLVICGRELFADFLVVDLLSFDAVFRMDWLGSFFTTIDCCRQSVVFEIPDHPRFEFLSSSTSTGHVEYIARPKKETLATMQVESEKPVVVQEFGDIFPDDIYGLPPDRAIEFSIDLNPRVAPIFKTPYRMPPAELAELRT